MVLPKLAEHHKLLQCRLGSLMLNNDESEERMMPMTALKRSCRGTAVTSAAF